MGLTMQITFVRFWLCGSLSLISIMKYGIIISSHKLQFGLGEKFHNCPYKTDCVYEFTSTYYVVHEGNEEKIRLISTNYNFLTEEERRVCIRPLPLLGGGDGLRQHSGSDLLPQLPQLLQGRRLADLCQILLDLRILLALHQLRHLPHDTVDQGGNSIHPPNRACRNLQNNTLRGVF